MGPTCKSSKRCMLADDRSDVLSLGSLDLFITTGPIKAQDVAARTLFRGVKLPKLRTYCLHPAKSYLDREIDTGTSLSKILFCQGESSWSDATKASVA